MRHFFTLILGLVMTVFSHQAQPVAITSPGVVIAVPVPNPTAAVEPETKTPKTSKSTPTKSPKVSVGDLVVPKTETEQDTQIDQSTIKNIEQDSRLDNLDTKTTNLQNQVSTPTPTPTPLPVISSPVIVPDVPQEVDFHSLSGYIILPGDKLIDILIQNPSLNDKFILTFNGSDHQIIFDSTYKNTVANYVNFHLDHLATSGYTFTLRIDRGNKFGITNGSFSIN